MAACTGKPPGLPVLSLKRPRHEVSHVQWALRNDTVLIVADESSKKFICYSLINEFAHRNSEKWTVLVADNSSGEIDLCTKQLVEMLFKFLPDEPVNCLSNKPVAHPSLPSLNSGNGNKNVLVTSSDHILQCFSNGSLKATDVSLVILNSSLPLNNVIGTDHPCKEILKVFRKEIVRPRIIGLMHLKLAQISNAVDLKEQLEIAELIYGLPIHLSSDLLAMNSYREEIVTQNIVYDRKVSSSLTENICRMLIDIFKFLENMNIQMQTKWFNNLKALVAWSLDILLMFGLWSFHYNLQSIVETFQKLQAKESNSTVILAIQLCKSQFELFEKLAISTLKTPSLDHHSELLYKICDYLVPYQMSCNIPQSCQQNEPENFTRAANEQNSRASGSCEDQETKDDKMRKTTNHTSLNDTSKIDLETNLVKLSSKDHFRCIIVVRRNSLAKMLSKLINYLSSSNEKYSFLKSGHVSRSRKESPNIENKTEEVLRAVKQGVFNIVVTTCDLSSDLLVGSCNVLVYFGVPDSYFKYFGLKRKIRGIAPTFICVIPEEDLPGSQRNLQVFKDIEEQFEKRVPKFISRKRKEIWLKCLGKETLPCYEPFGENGPRIPMVSSIHVVNRYCQKITGGTDFSSVHAEFITHEETVSENTTAVKSTLYLPLGCFCQQIIEGPTVKINTRDDLKTGTLRSTLEASLKFVKLLHENGDMDDDLELTEKQFFDPCNEVVENCELEDEGKGRAGTNKRRRVYEIKTPSFFQDNMPLPQQPLFLYKIELERSKVYDHLTVGVLEQSPVPEIKLGIISRKRLPRIPKFIIYALECEIAVSITSLKSSGEPLYLDSDSLKSIKEFHQYIFQDLLKFSSQSRLSEKDGYLVVPLIPGTTNNTQIHFSFLRDFERAKNGADNPRKSTGALAGKDFGIFENKVVQSSYHSAARNQRYFVIDVCKDLNPTSPFPNLEVASTFAEYYQKRHQIEVSREQPLLSVQYAPTQVNFLYPRYFRKESSSSENVCDEKEKSRRAEIHLIPELCHILPLSASAWRIISYLPTIAHCLSKFLLVEELRCRIREETGIGCNAWPDELPLPLLSAGDSVGEERLDNVSQKSGAVKTPCLLEECALQNQDDYRDVNSASPTEYRPIVDSMCKLPSPTTGPKIGPSITLLLRALTARSADLGFHSEHLELLGDSLLKFEVSLELYLSEHQTDERALSILRGHRVSNDRLSTQGRRLGLPGLLTSKRPDIAKNSLPPSFTLDKQSTRTENSVPDCKNITDRSLNTYHHQVIGDKLVANCVEALIGAYLVSCGRRSARQLLIWFDVAKHTQEELEGLFNDVSNKCKTSQIRHESKMINDDDTFSKQGFNFLPLSESGQVPDVGHIEKRIGYRFQNKFLLLRALTHSSYSRSLAFVAESYQKLEFLGDAVLDYLVTLFLFARFPQLNHGDLTDFRSALVNNFTVAFLAVQSRLHQFLRCMSPPLIDVIGRFVEFLDEQESKQGASWKTSVDAFVVGNPEVEDSNVEVPKVLGDLFEALVCAVFLDCGMNLDCVWGVFYPMFQPFIDYYRDNIPRSPVRTLQETFPEQVKFSLARLTLSEKYVCKVHVVGYGNFEVSGRTPKIAKSSVARKALQHIRNMEANC